MHGIRSGVQLIKTQARTKCTVGISPEIFSFGDIQVSYRLALLQVHTLALESLFEEWALCLEIEEVRTRQEVN